MASNTFSLGISAEQKLAMPLDDLIKKSKKQHKTSTKPKGETSATTKKTPVKKQKKNAVTQTTTKRRQQNVKKTVSVPVAKSTRAKAAQAASSVKRQAVINKRRPGLVVPAATKSTRQAARGVPVQLRSRKTSALRVNQKVAKQTRGRGAGKANGGLDVSNIVNHFRTHPTKFDLPKGTNLRITINLGNVKPVVGSKK